MQNQRDNLAKSGGTPAQLQALDNMVGVYKANLKADNDQAQQAAQSKKAGEVAAETSPSAIQGAADKAKAISDPEQANKLALQDNAAGNKPQKVQSTEWNTGVGID